jgi:hypothetical protein
VRAYSILKAVLSSTVAAAIACDSSAAFGPFDVSRLVMARSRWDARPFADYSYEVRIACFCPPEITRWTRVSVVDGAVVAAEAVEPDPDFPIHDIRYWRPIDSLFVELLRSMTEPAARTYLDAIVVDYDTELGYPTSIEYRAKRTVADGGSTYALRNVQPLVADRR